jgi:NAD(P)-dependent dehydrogenase (short-subunit alcohol dehydrogenase family)
VKLSVSSELNLEEDVLGMDPNTTVVIINEEEEDKKMIQQSICKESVEKTKPISRTFLITGASKGIGRAVADQLAAKGHIIVGLARHADDSTFPGELVAVDLSNSLETKAILTELTKRYTFDGLVNNVGMVRAEMVGNIQLDDLEEILRLNLYPTLQATQAILPGLRQRGWGRIVNISSLTTLGIIGRTSYAAAKSAIASFTRTWALELATLGITVNTVSPGPTETELFKSTNPAGSEGEKRYISGVPMNRLGKPEEIAGAVIFLLSEDAAFITGQNLFVDGGSSIGKAQM